MGIVNLKIENRTKNLTVRVCPGLLNQAQLKLNEFNAKKLGSAKNKRNVTKVTMADLFEQCLIEYISKE